MLIMIIITHTNIQEQSDNQTGNPKSNGVDKSSIYMFVYKTVIII